MGTDLGAPVISIRTSDGTMTTMPGYEAYVEENGVGFNDQFSGFDAS